MVIDCFKERILHTYDPIFSCGMLEIDAKVVMVGFEKVLIILVKKR